MRKANSSVNDSYDLLTTSSINYILRIIKNSPKANNESNLALLRQYREGNDDAFELLIKTNLALVVKIAKRYQKYCESFELIDLIHEGVYGLIKAIAAYDFDRKKNLSTLATACITNEMRDCLSKYDKKIRRQSSVSKLVRKYNAIINERIANGEKIPSDEEFCEILDTNPRTLLKIKEDYKFNVKSLNDRVRDDEASELEYFVDDKINWNEDFINQIRDKSLLLSLKKRFGAYKYYILYKRIFAEEKVKDGVIADTFGIGKAAVSGMETRIREELEKVITTMGIDALITEYDEQASTEPLEPEEIISYLFYRDSLTEEEKQLYKLIVSKEYIYDEKLFANIMGVSAESYNRILNNLNIKINNNDESLKKVYDSFKSEIIKKYGTKLLAIDLDTKLDDVETNIKYVANLWNKVSYEEALRIINKKSVKLPKIMDVLISRYFNSPSNYNNEGLSVRRTEQEVNSLLFDFNKNNVNVINGLYDFLIANKQAFSDEEYYYLLMRVFHKINRRDFKNKFPKYKGNIYELMYRLESMYFNISKYNEYNFTKEKYESMRYKALKLLSVDKIDVLDKYYGVNQDPMSIKEIASSKGISYGAAKDLIRDSRIAAAFIYVNRNKQKYIEPEYYVPYILDEDFDLPDLTRNIMREFLIEGLTYSEITAKHKDELYPKRKDEKDSKRKNENRKVIDLISACLDKIDFYRFRTAKMGDEFSESEINLASNSFNDIERKVIDMKLAGKNREEITNESGLPLGKVKYILNKFYEKCREIRVEKVTIDISDIKKEVTCHISERVLDDAERLLLSEVYGVACELNPSGIQYGEQKFKERHKEYSKYFSGLHKGALKSIKMKRTGLKYAPIAYMDREELRISLLDPRIPMDEKSYDILCYSFELNGYPYKSLKELESMYGITEDRLKQKIQRAFVTIFKYENDEIEPSVSYEYDVEPYLRYFAKSDQLVLKDLYLDKLSYEQIAKRNELTTGQVEKLVIRLEVHLHDLWDEKINGFDFDYFWAHVDDDDVPFYGDKEKAKRVFYLYYEKRMSMPDIINTLNLNCSRQIVDTTINRLMIAVLKRKEGIKKINTYSYDDIKEYYDKYAEFMDDKRKDVYDKYFKYAEKLQEENSLSMIDTPSINLEIILDLIKDKKEDAFEIGKASREEVINIIRTYKHLLTKTAIKTLIHKYGIEQRELMSGSEQMKVLRFLSTINGKDNLLSFSQSA